jgi:hypothetical protein
MKFRMDMGSQCEANMDEAQTDILFNVGDKLLDMLEKICPMKVKFY